MTLAGDALEDLFAVLQPDVGGTVTVSRAGAPGVELEMLRGFAKTERFGDDDFYGSSHQDDFIFRTAEYKTAIGGFPDTVDIIEWADPDNPDLALVRRFQVSSDGRERCYDPFAQFGQLLIRVHTVEIEVGP